MSDPVVPENQEPVEVPNNIEEYFDTALALEGWNNIMYAEESEIPDETVDQAYYVSVAIYKDPAFITWAEAVEDDEESSPLEQYLAGTYSDYTILVEMNAERLIDADGNMQAVDESMAGTGFCIMEAEHMDDEDEDGESEDDEDGESEDDEDGESEDDEAGESEGDEAGESEGDEAGESEDEGNTDPNDPNAEPADENDPNATPCDPNDPNAPPCEEQPAEEEEEEEIFTPSGALCGLFGQDGYESLNIDESNVESVYNWDYTLSSNYAAEYDVIPGINEFIMLETEFETPNTFLFAKAQLAETTDEDSSDDEEGDSSEEEGDEGVESEDDPNVESEDDDPNADEADENEDDEGVENEDDPNVESEDDDPNADSADENDDPDADSEIVVQPEYVAEDFALPWDRRFDKGDSIEILLISSILDGYYISATGTLENGPEEEGDDEGDAAVSNFAMASLATAASLIVATSF